MINLLEYLEETAKNSPNKTAFLSTDRGETITFGELLTRAKSVGSFLGKGNSHKQPVVVFMDKCPDEVAAFLGVLYGGDYYVPVDKEMPRDRITYIFNIVNPDQIICDNEEKLEYIPEKYRKNICFYKEINSFKIDVELLEKKRREHTDMDPAYIVFTSGSTGVPKGVITSHRSVIDYVEQLSEILYINGETIFGNQTPLYVDASLKEVYPTLKFGAVTYFIPKKKFMFPVELVEFLNEYKINTICWVVPALTIISGLGTFQKIKPRYLRTIAFGSEVFPVRQFNLWYNNVKADYINLYGPTECTGMSCYYRADRTFQEDEVIPIGKAFANKEVFLLVEKEDGTVEKICENQENVEGEILIRGTSLALGYYKNPEKTGEVFVQNPFQTDFPELVYKTGDIGKYVNGQLIFVSRKDFQIKHMGHRIELGEIEAQAEKLQKILNCVCIYVEECSTIVLYYTGEMREEELRAILKEKLPSYMRPGKVIKLNKMPLTINGKTDRQRLKQQYNEKKEG